MEKPPPVWTSIIPLVAGAAVYFAFAYRLDLHSRITWWQELLEVAPALMFGLLYQTFVLLPLRVVFARARLNNPPVFLAVSALVWLAMSALIIRGTNALPNPWVYASVIMPGIVIALTFTLLDHLINPRL